MGLPREILSKRTSDSSFIQHNKFLVLLKEGNPISVWTGSTNFTAGGIFGQSNVGHIVRDPPTAAAFLAYWEQLRTDPKVLCSSTFLVLWPLNQL